MNNLLLIPISLLLTSLSQAQSVWNGSFTTSTAQGTVHFQINTTTDTMTILNMTGNISTQYGPSQVTTLYALTDYSSIAGTLANPTSSTFNVTDALFQGNFETALGMTPNDGWYWASTTSNPAGHFNMLLGGTSGDIFQPSKDFTGSPSATAATFSVNSNSSQGTAINDITATQIVPEPSSSALLGLGAIGLLLRRKR